jgi:thiol-disulfide isomerase/thioredoxin
VLRSIVPIFILVTLFTGCEDRTTLEKLSLKLADVNSSLKIDLNIENNHTQVVNIEPEPLLQKVRTLTLKTINGKDLNLTFLEEGIEFSNYKDKIVILDIFTTWCPPCIYVLPDLVKLQDRYKTSIQFIGILMEDGRRDSEMLQFKQKYKINYPITNSQANRTLVDTWGGVSGYPTIIIFNKKGEYFHHFNGAVPYEILEAKIEQLL